MPSLLCDLGVAARVVQDGKILLVQEASGTYQGKWGLPKGHVDRERALKQLRCVNFTKKPATLAL